MTDEDDHHQQNTDGSNELEARPRTKKRRASFNVVKVRQSAPSDEAVITVRFGWALRQRRRQQHLTQVELAEASGVSRTHISEIENGKLDSLTLKVADRLARALGCDLADLLARPPKQ